jgi:hypothetical protein
MPLMTELIRNARSVLDKASSDKGRPVLLGVRTPGTLKTCHRIGLDIETWLKENLVDRLLIGGGYTPFTNPAEELVKLGHQYGVPVYPCINCGVLNAFSPSDEAMRGAASNIFWAGADGIYLWNYHYRNIPKLSYGRPETEAYQLLDEIQSASALTHKNKLFAVDYVGNIGPYAIASYPGQVPLELDGTNKNETIHIRVGDDLESAERAGHLKRAELLLGVSGYAKGDRLALHLNDTALEPGSAEVLAEGGSTQIRSPLSASVVRQGMNRLDLSVAERRSDSSPLTLEQVWLEVEYS